MQLAIFLPLIIGIVGILQGSFNRVMSDSIGLTWAVIYGNIFTLILATICFFVVKYNPELFPDFIKIKPLNFKWWYIIPGIFGLIIMAGLPYAIYKVGAVKTTVGLIAAQMVTSVVWDVAVEQLPVTLTKFLGVVFAMLSVAMISLF